jgi:catechol 2,3-dioxygenase-like lactoylglutathione lyase family enzyme
MFKITGLRSWNFPGTDLEDMVKFYCDGLGAEEQRRQEVGGGQVARLRIGESGVGLFDKAASERITVPHHTFRFEGPAEPTEMVQELEAKGIEVVDIRRHAEGEGAGYSVYVIDPAGNRLELSTDPPR